MRRENQRALASLESDLRIARMKEADLSQRLGVLKRDVSQMNGADVTLRALERKAEADRRLLDDLDRKSTRLTPVTNAHLVCRLLLEKKKQQRTKTAVTRHKKKNKMTKE